MAISVLHGCDGGCIVVLTPRDVGGGGASDGDEGGGQTRWNCVEGEVVTHDHMIYSIRITSQGKAHKSKYNIFVTAHLLLVFSWKPDR